MGPTVGSSVAMRHVLLIEDNPADVLLVREAMRSAPIAADVWIAYDGEQALRLLGECHPDLIILDLNLPKVGGLEVLEKHAGVESPVLVFTGSDNPIDRARAMALGAREYITKPMSWDEFMQVIRGAIERWMPTLLGSDAG